MSLVDTAMDTVLVGRRGSKSRAAVRSRLLNHVEQTCSRKLRNNTLQIGLVLVAFLCSKRVTRQRARETGAQSTGFASLVFKGCRCSGHKTVNA